ncbi:F-box associated domain-containing protein [Caenorhabditis elegans]|uniref:F-box associated domain-containing protein n=1 Tax=Caenorhabditis elegans TaxID=6239 RepID=Q95X85_CAEEL|nr:F-box associated domain-containing protein [Caenorhabditis elegans]CCD68468.1 F-box associated domain-containing protein [Caenorhabditis elegans]|eukprot:NP_494330.2 Uncharacterized protein CELE_F22E5.17 [Caenorhabditis elegans]
MMMDGNGSSFPLFLLPTVALDRVLCSMTLHKLVEMSTISNRALNYVKSCVSRVPVAFTISFTANTLRIYFGLDPEPWCIDLLEPIGEIFLDLTLSLDGKWHTLTTEHNLMHILEFIRLRQPKLGSVQWTNNALSNEVYQHLMGTCAGASTWIFRMHCEEDFWHNPERFQKESFLLKSIEITQAFWITLEHLNAFHRCTRIKLKNMELTSQEVNVFLKGWTENSNLEHIRLDLEEFDGEVALEGLPLRKVTAEKKLDMNVDRRWTVYKIEKNDGTRAVILTRRRRFVLKLEQLGFDNE